MPDSSVTLCLDKMSSIWLERRAPYFGGLPRVVSHLHNPGDFSASFSWVVFRALAIESRRGRAGRIANRICYVSVPRFSFNIVAAHFEACGLCSVLSRREQPISPIVNRGRKRNNSPGVGKPTVLIESVCGFSLFLGQRILGQSRRDHKQQKQ